MKSLIILFIKRKNNDMIELGDHMETKKMKKKIRVKKKNLAIAIFILMVIVFLVSSMISALLTPKEETKKTKKQKVVITNEERKLQELNHINEKIDYFNNDFINRYVAYKRKNKDLTDEDIIKQVNMNLDKKQYTYRIEARNLNTEKILVNKYYYVAEDYVPEKLKTISKRYALSGMKLVDTAKEAFEEMAEAAEEEDLSIIAMSSYRSYDYQVNLYNDYVKKDSKDVADTYSGRPGHSEHQTGYAVDVYDGEIDYTKFEKTKEYKWMLEHAHEYGFILRFPKDKEKETGYHFESWHYRYVGKEAATYIKENNLSFEEYYATIIKDW